MNLVKNLIDNITNDNSMIVYELVTIITDHKFQDIKELSNFEDSIFTFNNKILNQDERIKYCIDLYNSFPGEYVDLTFEQCQLEKNYLNILKEANNNSDKIKILIKLFALTGRQIYFITEAYNFIIAKEI